MLKTLLPALLLSTQLTHADILNSTSVDEFQRSINGRYTEFFDEARNVPYTGTDGQLHNPNGWVSLYGALNGGTTFTMDLDTGLASWNFVNTDYSMWWILTYTTDTEQLFEVRKDFRLIGSVTLPSGTNIVGFYGKGPETRVSEGGMSLTLFILALVFLLFYDQKAIS